MSSNEEIVVIDPVTVEETPVVIETPVVVEIPVELPLQTYEYQPTDEDGRPIGGKQVIKYRDNDELRFKLTEQNTLLIRKLREQTRKARLGILDNDSIDEKALRFQTPLEFKPRELTGDERYKLAQEMLDPDTFDKAVNTIFEASTGIAASDLRNTLTTLQTDNQSIKAQREVDKFIQSNPDFVKCQENSDAITSWMERYNLAPVAENFQKAYDTLKSADVLVTSVEVIQQPTYTPPTPVVAVVEEPVIETPAREEIPVEEQIPVVVPPPAPVVSRVPSGLSRSNSSDAGVPPPIGDDIVYEYVQRDGQGRQVGEKKVFKGLAAINAMPGEEYKHRLLHEKGFGKKVEKLEAEAAKRRAQR